MPAVGMINIICPKSQTTFCIYQGKFGLISWYFVFAGTSKYYL